MAHRPPGWKAFCGAGPLGVQGACADVLEGLGHELVMLAWAVAVAAVVLVVVLIGLYLWALRRQREAEERERRGREGGPPEGPV